MQNVPFAKRAFVLVFSLTSYLVGFSALMGWILSMMRVMPFEEGPLVIASKPGALLFNLFLASLFAVQHSVMARPAFKRFIIKRIPEAIERSTYVFLTGVVVWPVLILWQTNPSTIWEVSNPLWQNLIIGVGVLGWAYMFIASFCINHFELFGVEQGVRYFLNRPIESVPFQKRLLYRFDRHPIMTGLLIGMWATPVMRADHFQFSLIMSFYISLGVSLEERDLRQVWGDKYKEYKKKAKTIVLRFG